MASHAMRTLLLVGAATVFSPSAHAAENWPTRPIRLVLSFGAAGGAPDMTARLLAPKLTEMWGRQVVVDPRSGAGGVLGTDIAAKSPPDGYTMVIVSPAHAINPAFRKLPYDSVKDFEPVTKLNEVPNILAIYPQVAAKNPQEMAALAKALGGQVKMAHVADAAAALPLAREAIGPGDAVLVKGSNSIGLAALVDALASGTN